MSTEWIFICSHYNKLVKDSDPWHGRNLPSFDICNKIIPKRAGKKPSSSPFLSIKWDLICIMRKNTNNLVAFCSSFYKASAWGLILPRKSGRFSWLCWREKPWMEHSAPNLCQENVEGMCWTLVQPAQGEESRDSHNGAWVGRICRRKSPGKPKMCSLHQNDSRASLPLWQLLTDCLWADPIQTFGWSARILLKERKKTKQNKTRQESWQRCVITNRCTPSKQLMSLCKVFWKYINRGNPQMAPFQCILEGGRMGHATANPKLKDEKDKKKKKRRNRKKCVFFFFSPEIPLQK